MVRKNLSNLLSVLLPRAANGSHFLESRLVIESRLTEKCFLSDFCLQMDVRGLTVRTPTGARCVRQKAGVETNRAIFTLNAKEFILTFKCWCEFHSPCLICVSIATVQLPRGPPGAVGRGAAHHVVTLWKVAKATEPPSLEV